MAPFFQLDDLYESNLKLYLQESFFQNTADALPKNQLYRRVKLPLYHHKFHIFNIFFSPNRPILNRLFVYDGDMNALRNLTNDNANIAIMSTSQIVDYFNFLHFPNIQILKTKQYIQALPFCMYLRKHSFLEKPFNQQLNSFSSSGLIFQWAKNFKKQSFKSDRIEPRALSFDQIAGVLLVCIFMTVTSLIVFICELMSSYHATIKTVMDFFTFKTNPIPRYKLAFFQRNYHCKRQAVISPSSSIAQR